SRFLLNIIDKVIRGGAECQEFKNRKSIPTSLYRIGSKSSSMSFGEVCGLYRLTMRPFLSIKNFAKFHSISSVDEPFPDDVKYLKRGSASSPFTSIFSNIGNVTP